MASACGFVLALHLAAALAPATTSLRRAPALLRGVVDLTQAPQQLGPDLAPLFEPPHPAERIANGTSIGSPAGSSASVDACATACLKEPQCVSFTYDSAVGAATCRLSGYSMSYDRAVAPNTSAWHIRRRPRNDTALLGPAVDYTLSVPTGGVTLHPGILSEGNYKLTHGICRST